jgi:hypothetical protein
MGENCSSSCRTKDHATWGDCVRAKSLKVAYAQDWKGKDATAQKKADKNLDEYAKARKYGIQPKSTRPNDVQAAVRISEQTGTAFQA